ncbi:MAG: 30S ribosomal protein S6 [Candidatus Paceibacterota bacterium]
MNYYELTYLLNPKLEDPESSIEDLVDTIRDQGAELDSKTDAEEIKLGSSIKPKLGDEVLEKALAGSIEFYLESAKVNDLRDKLSQKRDVLRVMIVKKKEESTEPEPESQTEQEEDKKVELEDIDQKLDEILEEE